ncbi:Protein translocase subunit SecE [hydrothermal vent metagenome]|uniref:Protein translocase subunit SecE n=1 Tax=hydrothermal vent metagenome TaxID=652676 RepID=A0A3B0QQP9_9ZZZZ
MEKIDKAKAYFQEAKVELKKVTWPSKPQTMQLTWVVIVMVVISAIFFGVVDFVLSGLVKIVLG